jgi:puromycin-sensitive aminopeptidase
MSSDRVLLPANVIPSHYAITLEPNFTTFKAQGYEEISVSVKEATKTILVHSKSITISSVELVGSGKTLSTQNITFDEKDDVATFEFDQSLPVGDAVLKIKFEATLNDDMAGFYRSKYVVNGETRWMATTQFEATDARRAFPCWDEPARKAVFEITLVVPTDRVALSNMLPVSETVNKEANTKTLKFAPSPIMSTYLVAFVVGEFDYVEDHTKDQHPVRVRVYTPPGKQEMGRFALDVATKTLSYFAEYFGIHYPLPKLDMVAIADFAAGAMENWGLVTYREIALLVDEKNASVTSKQRVAYIVAHELAHQWFGNLVTMEWWNNLWLNEGFATFVGNLATNHLFPQWDIWTLFVNDYQFSAFELDSLRSSHPIEVDVKNSAQINEIFDAISYHKGSCVIRMLESHLGEENFKLGLNRYLKRFDYKNAVTEDLWQALSEQSGVDVKTFMGSYTKNVGYPIVSVKRGAQEGELEVSQERFLGGDASDDDTLWHIAADIAHKNEVSKQTFSTKTATLRTKFKNTDWVKLNYGQSGFYRVKYSADLLAQLLVPLKNFELKPVDRLGVQGDVFALAKAGLLPTSQFLDVASALSEKETDYTVWNSLASNIGAISSLWSKEPVAPQLSALVQKLFLPTFNRLGWKPVAGERDVDALLRSIALRKLAAAKYQPVIDEARKIFKESLSNPSALPADIRSPVYEAVAANGDEATFNQIVELYKKADTPELRVLLLQVLPLQPTPELTKKAFEFSLGPDVRDQDLYMLYFTCHGVPHGGEVAWQFLRDNWDQYFQRLSKGSMMLARIIGKGTEKFSTAERAKEVEQFFTEHPFAPAERTVKQSIENIGRNAKWLSSARDDVAAWLKNN